MGKHIIFTDHKDPILTTYLKEIGKFKLYSAAELLELVEKAKEGDLKSRNKVIQSNLRFVVMIAKKYQGRGVPLLDLISEGTNGLIYSIDKFDINKGTPFISYAAFWIKQFIHQTIYWTGREIRLPVSQQVKVIQLLKVEAEFTKEHSRNPSTSELSHLTGISEEDINYLAQFSNKLISVDDFLGGDSDNNQVCDVIPDGEPLLDEQLDQEYMQRNLKSILEKLPIREHDIICMLFGIGMEPMKNKDIGDMYGIGIERVRQIKESALKRLYNKYGNKIKHLFE